MNLVFVRWRAEGMKFCFLGHLRNEADHAGFADRCGGCALCASRQRQPPRCRSRAAVVIPLGRETFVSRVHNLPNPRYCSRERSCLKRRQRWFSKNPEADFSLHEPLIIGSGGREHALAWKSGPGRPAWRKFTARREMPAGAAR